MASNTTFQSRRRTRASVDLNSNDPSEAPIPAVTNTNPSSRPNSKRVRGNFSGTSRAEDRLEKVVDDNYSSDNNNNTGQSLSEKDSPNSSNDSDAQRPPPPNDSTNSEQSVSEKASSEASSSSGASNAAAQDSLASKSKEELIKAAQELELQFQDLIKVYQHEKKSLLEKSIKMLENDEHPIWMTKMEEVKQKKELSLTTAMQRRKFKMESIQADYNFAVKNIQDELQAAEEEIIDEFMSKRRRRTKQQQPDLAEWPEKQTSSADSIPRISLTENEIKDDLDVISSHLLPRAELPLEKQIASKIQNEE